MDRKIKVIGLIFFIILVIVGSIALLRSTPPNINTDYNKIDSLQNEIDSLYNLRDSIDQRIDTITVVIEKTHIQYEKDRNTIINNTTSEDYVFFCEYVRSSKARFDSIYNP